MATKHSRFERFVAKVSTEGVLESWRVFVIVAERLGTFLGHVGEYFLSGFDFSIR